METAIHRTLAARVLLTEGSFCTQHSRREEEAPHRRSLRLHQVASIKRWPGGEKDPCLLYLNTKKCSITVFWLLLGVLGYYGSAFSPSMRKKSRTRSRSRAGGEYTEYRGIVLRLYWDNGKRKWKLL